MTDQLVSQAPASAAVKSANIDRTGGTRLVGAELRKIFTTNTWWLLGILLLVFTGLAFLTNMASGGQQLDNIEQAKAQGPPDFSSVPPEFRPSVADQQRAMDEWRASTDLTLQLGRVGASIFTSGQYFGLLLIVILGCLVVTNEFYHQTATATFLATPQRTRVIFAKLSAAVIFAAGFWAITTVVSVGLGSAFFAANGYDIPLGYSGVGRAIAMNLLAFIIWAVLGIGLGVLLRSQIGATVTSVIIYLVSLPATFVIFSALNAWVFKTDAVWKFAVLVPSIASMIMVTDGPIDLLPLGTSPSWWIGMLVLIGYGVLAGVVGTLITRRRDIS